ncbi:hypothetical protein DPMN_190846 [Dreissena polymorpha]|uniref:Uncharacterized protein n=1 Tax=Dreissena polymorpha TaxID=45954 RepID=A0A9D4BC81_DREPO|nr:hypothetical protein DPMN_190846 [Dreissena polymorpha]
MTESHFLFCVHDPIEHKRANGTQLSMPKSYIFFVHLPNGNARMAKHASNAPNSVGDYTLVLDESLASQVFF